MDKFQKNSCDESLNLTSNYLLEANKNLEKIQRIMTYWEHYQEPIFTLEEDSTIIKDAMLSFKKCYLAYGQNVRSDIEIMADEIKKMPHLGKLITAYKKLGENYDIAEDIVSIISANSILSPYKINDALKTLKEVYRDWKHCNEIISTFFDRDVQSSTTQER